MKGASGGRPGKSWLEGLELAVEELCRPVVRKAKALRPMQKILQLPVRRTSAGREICRFASYATCSKGENCRFDHHHCHRCLEPGHLAADCTREVVPEVGVALLAKSSPGHLWHGESLL